MTRAPVLWRSLESNPSFDHEANRIWLLPEDGRAIELTDTAAEVWHLLDRPRTRQDLARLLAERGNLRPSDSSLFDLEATLAALAPFLVMTDRGEAQSPEGPSPVSHRSGAAELVRLKPTLSSSAAAVALAFQVTCGIEPAWLEGPIDIPAGDVAECLRQRLLPGLARAVHLGFVALDDVGSEVLSSAQEKVTGHALRCELTFKTVCDAAADAGVDFRVAKGLATSHLDYTEPGLRQFGDIDILVRADDHERFISELHRRSVSRIAGGDRGDFRLYKSQYLITHEDIEIDLHHRLLRHGRPWREDVLWSNGDVLTVGASQGTALGRVQRLVHAAAHAIFSGGGSNRISGYLDACVIANRHPETVTPAIEMARALHLDGLVSLGIERSLRLGGVDVDLGIDRSKRRRVRDHIALWAFSEADRHRSREQVSLALGLGPIDAVRWLAAFAKPAADYRIIRGEEP